MPRLALLLLAMLLAPGAAAAPVGVSLDEEGASAEASVGSTSLSAHARPGEDAGQPLARAELWRAGDDAVGEEVVTVELGDPSFAGTHSAPAGHDLRIGVGTSWRSAHVSYAGDVAGRHVTVGAGTFHALGQRFGYFDARVDGQGPGEFGAIPSPV